MGDVMKGQGASEYLIILAVVLIVALVAIGLLGAFPSFGGDARVSESRQYWSGTRPFAITEWTQKADVFTASLKNQETERLVLDTLNISAGPGNEGVNRTGIVFNGGASKPVIVSGLRACDTATYDYFEYNVIIIYNTSNIGGNRVAGNKPLIGPCNP